VTAGEYGQAHSGCRLALLTPASTVLPLTRQEVKDSPGHRLWVGRCAPVLSSLSTAQYIRGTAEMARRSFTLTDEELLALDNFRTQCQQPLLRTRLLAVRLYGTGHSVAEIRSCTGCSRASLMGWCRKYRRCGLPGLQDQRRAGGRAKLARADVEDLRRRLRAHSPRDLFGPRASTSEGRLWTIEDLQRAVKAWYQVVYRSRESYRRLFGLCGFSYHRAMDAFVACSMTVSSTSGDQADAA